MRLTSRVPKDLLDELDEIAQKGEIRMSRAVEDVSRQLRGRRLDEKEIEEILQVLRACYVPSQSPKEIRG